MTTLKSAFLANEKAIVNGVTVKKDKILRGGETLLIRMSNGKVLLNVTVRNKLNLAQHQALDELLAVLQPVILIDDLKTYFDPKKRFDNFMAGTATLDDVVTLTAAEKALPATIAGLKAKLASALTIPVGPYQFDTRPVVKPLTVKTTKAGKKTAIGNGRYTLGYSTAKRLFEKHMVKGWREREVTERGEAVPYSLLPYVSASGYRDNQFRVYSDRIEIGCQTIQRNQIEQLAKAEGWSFG